MNIMQVLSDLKRNAHDAAAKNPGVSGVRQAAGAKPGKVSGADSSGTNANSNNGTNITSTDFLQLLVAEMKNQDPTQAQDPNAYIDQLVQVNSLQQLIQINQDLGGSSNSSGSTTGSGAGKVQPHASNPVNASATAVASALLPKHAQPEKAAQWNLDQLSRQHR